ncbi:hypothetical protein Golomagni_06441 [Golovinomyces magnicellulatus]|nr:hypothetical protein Golomagni_06441 [Golovinomyces magnicellulatus]
MASASERAPAHRNVANIRSVSNQGQTTPAAPHTPPRAISSNYGSPATIRADDDFILMELGSRYVRVGFAGDTLPKVKVSCGPDTQRRVGDFRRWQGHGLSIAESWTTNHEIWRYDVRDLELDLVKDRLERLLREAFAKFLLIDSRARRVGLVMDSSVPIPLVSAVLDTLFNTFQTPMVSLMSSPTMTAVAGGVRSALVIDMGWTETVVTSVYEYREVKSTRTIRGGKQLLEGLYKSLHQLLVGKEQGENEEKLISFEECEDIMCRLVWCRPSNSKAPQRQSTQLDTVVEQDESQPDTTQSKGNTTIPLRSTTPPTKLEVPFDKLANLCDDTFFDPTTSPASFDDHELPVHLLVYQHLLQLPMDVRAVCMSRIMFTGGCSNTLGIKERIVDEVSTIVDRRGWSPVTGKGVDQLRNNMRLNRQSTISRTSETSAAASEGSEEGSVSSRPSSVATAAEVDAIEAKLARNKNAPPQIQGQMRAVHSLGPWTGASLLCQLKIPAMSTIDRELWLQQGASGASRPGDIDVKAQSRQSMGAGGLIRGSGGHHTNWTLGAWGAV